MDVKKAKTVLVFIGSASSSINDSVTKLNLIDIRKAEGA